MAEGREDEAKPTPIVDINDAISKMKSLSLTSADQLRATYAAAPLVWVGALMRPPMCGSREINEHASEAAAQKIYNKSFACKRIGAFWSHSWRAPYWQKVITLLFFYNGKAAAVIGTLSACIGCAMTIAGILPPMVWSASAINEDKTTEYGFSAWSTIFGLFAFFVTLLGWQSKKTVFLDKVCIHQTDAILRRKGIESIGAYLSHSNTMLVLWDPTYVTRLWCVFELAAFLHAHAKSESFGVLCRPVMVGPMTVSIFLVFAIEFMCILLLPASVVMTFVPTSSWVMFSILIHLLTGYHHSLKILQADFKHFQVSRAGCFCCNEARHNLRGCSMLCDRELVEGCIVAWFGSIMNFNHTVQSNLFDIFRIQLGTFALPYTSFLMAGTPVVWAFIDFGGVYWKSGASIVAIGTVGLGIACWVCVFPSMFALVSTLASTSFLQTSRSRAMTAVIAACVGGICNICIIISGAASFLSLQYLGSVAGPIAYMVLSGIVAAIVFMYGSHKHASGTSFPSRVMNMRGQSCDSLVVPDTKTTSLTQQTVDPKVDELKQGGEQNDKVEDESGGLNAPTEKLPEALAPTQKLVGVGLQKVVVEWC
mmetsp:Transcript_80927/g.203603  ORF Transcript_80927/g.203603 Transcript_80927/m.203603 type:complete len:594 (+) Transcript_80927:56-1837(+)